MYVLTADAKSRASDHVIIHKGEKVTTIKSGTSLILIEAKSSENEYPRRCWVPGHWLAKEDDEKGDVSRSLDSELNDGAIGELGL